MTTMEEWRPVVGYEGWYEVSQIGRVRRIKAARGTVAGRILRQYVNPKGYQVLTLSRPDAQRVRRVHVLVCEAFHGPRPAGMEVRHLDGARLNCHASNLAWGTRSDNMQDELRHGTHWHARRTHCKNGHEFTPENTMAQKGTGTRICRQCLVERHRARYLRLRAAS